MVKPKVREIYLGEGLYASYDGYHIRLRAPRGEGDYVIFMDHQTFLKLLKYANTRWSGSTEKKDGEERS